MTTKSKRILVDMDGILVDLLHTWLEDYNHAWNDTLTKDKILTWDMHEHVNPECGKSIYRFPSKAGYFRNLPAIPGAIAGFQALKKAGHDVVVCSSPYNAESAKDKQLWCREYLGTGWRDVTLTHKKDWFGLAADVIIDDKPSTLEKFAALGKTTVTLGYEYNKHLKDKISCYADGYREPEAAWAQIVEYLT